MKRTLSIWLALMSAMALASGASAQQNDHDHDHDHDDDGHSHAPTPSTPAPPNQGGKLSLNMEAWDFGMKWFGEECSADVVLTNTGTGPLTVVKVSSSCGCTVAKPKSGGVWNNKVLAPGESESMTLTYNTKKGARKVAQTVTIETNDAERPKFSFQVRGEVRDVFDAKPFNRVTFGRVDRDSKATQVIDLTNNMEEKVFLKLKPPADTTEHQPFTIELQEDEAGMKYKLVVTTNPPLASGGNTMTAELETGVAKMPVMSFPISAFIVPRVTISPPRLYMSPKVSRPFVKMLRVNYPSEQPINILEVRASHESVQAEFVKPENPEARAKMPQAYHEIRVSLPAADAFPEDGATVTIITDDPSPDYQKLEVPIMTQAQFRASAGNLPSNKEPITTTLRPQQAPRNPRANADNAGQTQDSDKAKKDESDNTPER